MWLARSDRDPTVLLQAIFTAGALVDRLVDEELEAAGVPSQLFSLLAWIYALGPISPTGLSQETGMPPTTLRDNLHRLVERGDVRRAPNPDDGRSYLIELTAAGRAKMRAALPPLRAVLARLTEHLPRPRDEYLRMTDELVAAATRVSRGERRPRSAAG